MALQELKRKIGHRMASFERRYETRTFFFPEEAPPKAVVQTNLYDPYHDMTLYLEVDLKHLKISDADVEEIRVPFSMCPKAIQAYKYLVGMDMSESKLLRTFPTDMTGACLHINELIAHAAAGFNAAYGFYLKDKNFPEDWDEYKMHIGEASESERLEIGRHWWMKDRNVRNTCLSFSTNQEVTETKEKIKKIPSITQMMVSEYKKAKG